MSDFVSPGWSWFVGLTTVLSLLWCIWLLLVAARRKVMAGDNTTGHVWDRDLKEFNNPLPRWWMGLFVLTVLFGAIYFALYPGLGARPGRLGWSSEGQYQAEQARAAEQLKLRYAAFDGMSPGQLMRDPQAQAIGQRLFLNNCSMCHGSDARGSKGFPNLTDDEWLWGGDYEQIVKSITLGRQGNMPAMAAAVGSADDVRNVAHYVLSLSGSPHNNLKAQLGRPRFGTCAACHGADGRGNPVLGAPNLANDIWLHGWGEEAIVRIVSEGKLNVMPAFNGRLSEAQIRILAAHVKSFSQPTVVAAN